MTNDTRTCPRQIGPKPSHRESQREPIRHREEGGEHRGRRAPRAEIAQPLRNREQSMIPGATGETQASSSKRKPVRRDLTPELGETVGDVEERRVAKADTKEWVRKSFFKEEGRVDPKSIGATFPIGHSEQTGGHGIHSTSWYRNSEEEALVAKMMYAQNEAWEKVDGTFRQLERLRRKLCTAWRGYRNPGLSISAGAVVLETGVPTRKSKGGGWKNLAGIDKGFKRHSSVRW